MLGITVRLVNRGTKVLRIRFQHKQVHICIEQVMFKDRGEHLRDSLHVADLFHTKRAG